MKANINFIESVTLALHSLRANKLRSFLTLLGIIIGVTTVITVITLVQGLNRYVKFQIFEFGSNTFSISRIAELTTDLKEYQEMLKRPRIDYEDFLYLKNNTTKAELVEASYGRSGTVKYMDRILKDIRINGETHRKYLTGRKMEIDAGRFLSLEDERLGRSICVIGSNMKKELFPYEDPIGKAITVQSGRSGGIAITRRYTVVGVVKELGKILGFSLDNFITVPITTFQKHYATRYRDINISIKAYSIETMEASKEEIRTLMRNRRQLKFDQDDNFSIEDSQTFLDFYNRITGVIFMAMIAIASISMLVGGIVIMNIMLVSVTDRINEIGLRKAVGARRRDILIQFLIESSSISAIGGLIGITIGFVFAKTISALTKLPAALEPWSVVLAIIMSSSIGLFFGLYPANRAAKLDPVEALRSE